MSLPKIKFSHTYIKFPKDMDKGRLTLLQVFKVNYMELSKEFIEYDTRYIDENEDDHQFYKLPKTDLLVLLFFDHFYYTCLTTIRRWTFEKQQYYRSMQGKEFEVVIEC